MAREWNRVALAVARKTGQTVGLNASTRIATDAKPVAQFGIQFFGVPTDRAPTILGAPVPVDVDGDEEFPGFSYGFRPKRNQDQALDALAFVRIVHRHRDNATVAADFHVGGVEPDIGPVARDRAIEVDLLAQPAGPGATSSSISPG
jgi:hypothetical protein